MCGAPGRGLFAADVLHTAMAGSLFSHPGRFGDRELPLKRQGDSSRPYLHGIRMRNTLKSSIMTH